MCLYLPLSLVDVLQDAFQEQGHKHSRWTSSLSPICTEWRAFRMYHGRGAVAYCKVEQQRPVNVQCKGVWQSLLEIPSGRGWNRCVPPRGYMRVNRGDETVLTGYSMRWPECLGGGRALDAFIGEDGEGGVWGLSRTRKCSLRKRGTWIRICITRSYMACC